MDFYFIVIGIGRLDKSKATSNIKKMWEKMSPKETRMRRHKKSAQNQQNIEKENSSFDRWSEITTYFRGSNLVYGLRLPKTH